MANEFVARKGLISSGSINVSGSVTASFFKGDGSQLTGINTTTAISGALSIDTYKFVGDDVTVNYTLSQSYSINSLEVYVGGLSLTPTTDYTLSTNTLTFITTPPSESNILVRAFVNVTQNATGSFSGSFQGLISSASYALTASYAANAGSGGGSGVTITGSAPSSPTNGDLWYENTTGKTYIYYTSASVSQWVLQSDPTYQPSPTLQDFQDVTDLGATTTNAITITNTTAAVSSGSGALVISGGLGVLGNARVKDLYANTLTGRLLGAADSASYVTFANVDNKPTLVSSSTQIDYNSIQNKLSGVVSSSTQVAPLLPNGTVSSSAQYPGWVTSSTQIDYNNIQNKLSGVISSSTQFNALSGTSASFATTAITASYISGNIQFNNGLDITGSLLVVGAISASSFTGSILSTNGVVSSSAQIDYNSIQNKLSGVVSSSTQVKTLLPGGTVSSSAQYPGWVTASSQIDYNSIQNKLSGVVSSSNQVQPLLPGGTVSSSAQYPGWVTASSQIDYNSIQNKLSGVISSSTQFNALTNTSASYALTSSFAQQAFQAVSASWAPASEGQTVSWNSVTNKPEGLVSSSLQFNSTSLPFTGSFTGSLTGSLFGTASWAQSSSQAISSSFATTAASVNTLNQSVSASGNIAAGQYLISNNSTGDEGGEILLAKPQTNSTIAGTGVTIDVYQNKLRIFEQGGSARGGYWDITALGNAASTNLAGGAGTVTSVATGDGLTGGPITGTGTITLDTGSTHFTQGTVKALPIGTVSSSAQYPGWVTSSTQVVWASVNYNSGIVSSSTQVKPLLPDGTVTSSAQYPGWVTASSQIDYNSIQNKLSGVYSSSAFTSPSQGTARLTLNGTALTDVDLGLQTTDSPTFSGLTSTGTVLLQGIYSSSTQVDYNSIQNKLSGVISSSTQFSSLTAPFTGSFTGSFGGNLIGTSSVASKVVTTFSSFGGYLALLPIDGGAQTPLYQADINYNPDTLTLNMGAATITNASSVTATNFFGTASVATSASFATRANNFSPNTVKLTVGTTAPSSPVTNDLWVDTN